ncbi:LysR family transcriptional regulator [Pseudoalteromonas sp. MMG010]|uniref:LysR family transcriptional regulator n=1 Tax=Pseudoalteromonas sp. MMG010 TaxID=2822685 RepID=UPI001B3A0C52|nr:LysR family transcriptional regulator [Pseudoalteromonas sp. MMG010]MBQ4832307.1 LysR family transcriptional regulator [Pseudoalteromonas sp. MMG010]
MARWDGIDEFIAVGEEGSFTAAAKVLGLSVAHISRHVTALEQRLNTQLLTRTTRKVVLTKEGEDFLHQAQHLQHAMDDATQQLATIQTIPKGKIKLTAPVMYGESFIMPLVHSFMQIHREVEVIATLTNEQENLLEGGYDLAIRLGHLKDSSLKARKLSQRRFIMCASAKYLSHFGEPHTVGELNNHQCLIGNSRYWRVNENGRDKHIKIAGRLACNSGWSLVDAAKKGLGIVQLPDYYIKNELKNGELIPILTTYQPKQEGVWGVYPPRQFVATNVRALLDYLLVGLS